MTRHADDGEAATQKSVTDLVIQMMKVRGPQTKRKLAMAIGMSPETLSHTLSPTGRRRPWKLHEVRRLATYYNIPVEALLGDSPARDAVIQDLKEYAAAVIDDET